MLLKARQIDLIPKSGISAYEKGSISTRTSTYTSHFARQLAEDDLRIEEQYQKLDGEEAPFLYVRGTEPIMGCFATSGIFVRSYFMSAHHASGSVGDHRLHVIDFCAVSILGVELPAVTKKIGRRLQYKLKPMRRK